MAETHFFYGNIKETAERAAKDDNSLAGQHAAALLLRGVGFSDHYVRTRSGFVLPTDVDEATGRMPLVGIDLSHIALRRPKTKEGHAPTLCPPDLEEVKVTDWYVGEAFLPPANKQDITVANLGANGSIGEIILHTDPTTIFTATRRAIESGVMPYHLLETRVPDLAQLTPPAEGAINNSAGHSGDPVTEAINRVIETMPPL